MAKVNFFDFDESIHGLTLTAKTRELSAACLGDGEIDYWVKNLKGDLDTIAAKMKRRLVVRRSESMFDA